LLQLETKLPFNEQTASTRNLVGIINSYNPQLYQASENMIR